MRHRFLFPILLLVALLAAPIAVAQQSASPLQAPATVFALPGQPFMLRLHTLQGACVARVSDLPEGLSWDVRLGRITGAVARPGTYPFCVATRLRDSLFTDTLRLLVAPQLQQPVPFMGMLTWNAFESHVSDTVMRLLADAMVRLGLRDAGYRYLCLDDLWAEPQRTPEGLLQPSASKFPHGLRPLADYLHAVGLRFGIYSDAGPRTCSGGQPGSLGFEESDAQAFARFGCDLLKYDFCNSPDNTRPGAVASYSAMSQVLRRHLPSTFLFYICEWGRLQPWEWGAEVGGSCWRATDDTRDAWVHPWKGGVKDNIDIFTRIWPYTGVNRFCDADMVMCGLHGKGLSSSHGTDGRGMSMHEYTTQFALWCMWSSPLTLCFDITTLYDGRSRIDTSLFNPHYREDLALITNPYLIALDQDPLCQAAEPLRFDSLQLLLLKPLADGSVAVSLTNLDTTARTLLLPLAQIPSLQRGASYRVWDLLQRCPLPRRFTLDGRQSSELALQVCLPPHATAVYRIVLSRKE